MTPITFDCDGVRLAGWQTGGGSRLVLVHGWSQSSRLFQPLAARLAPEHTVVGFDLRGHGESDAPDSGYTVGQLAVDLDQVLRQTGVDETPVSLVGHSMGCSVIWKYIEIFGTAGLSSLVLIDQSSRVLTTVPAAHQNMPKRFAKMSFQTLKERVVALRSPFASFDYVDEMFSDCASDEIRETAKAENRKLRRSTAADLLWDASLYDWTRLIQDIDLPSLIVGNAVGAYPLADLREMAESMPKASYVEIPESDGGSHMVILENPAEVARIIRQFLENENQTLAAL